MLKWLLVALGALVALVLGFLAAVPWLVDLPRVQAYISHAAGQALGRPVKFASLSVSGFPLPAVRLRGLQVAEDPRFGTAPILTVEEGRVGIRLLSLLAGRVELADLTLDRPRLAVVEDGGQWNLASLGAGASAGRSAPRGAVPAAGAAAAPAVSRVRVVDGTVRFQKRGARAADFRLEGINLTLGAAGRADLVGLKGDAVAQPGGVRVRVTDAAFTLGGRSLAEAPLRASIEVDARDVSALSAVVMASPELAGPVRGTLQLSGTPARLSATGELGLERLVVSQSRSGCPPPARRRFTLEDVRMPLALTPAGLESAPLRAAASGGTVSLRAQVTWQPKPLVVLHDISVKGMELAPLLVDYLCQGYAVSGPLELTGEATLGAGDPWRTLGGSGRLRVGRGKVVGPEALGFLRDVVRVAGLLSPILDPDGRSASLASPLDFDSITATYTVTNGVLDTRDLLYQSGRMSLAAAGTYGLADTRVDLAVTLHQGRTQLKAGVSGTANPRALRIVPGGAARGEPGGVRRLLERLLR